jgi:hypothetical protein
MGIRSWIIIRCLWNCNIFIRTVALTGGGVGAVALLAGAVAVLLVAEQYQQHHIY